MEVTCRLIIIGILGAMLFVSATADILVQPGYGQPNHKAKPTNQSAKVSSEPPQGERTLAEEFERYKTLHNKIEEQLVQLIHEQNAHNLQQIPPGLVGFPFILRPRVIHPLLPSISGGHAFSHTPAGSHGVHIGGYDVRKHPVLLRGSTDPSEQENAARNQYTRSVTDRPGVYGGINAEIHDVAAQPPVEKAGAHGVVKLQVPGANAGVEAIDKVVEPRQIGYQDAAIVGSPLDSVHYENPHAIQDQHHPSEPSGMSYKLVNAVNTAVAPTIMNYGNEDSAPAMTRHQEQSYRHGSQYPQLSQDGARTGSPSIWYAPTTRASNQPMTGQFYIIQPQLKNSEWTSIAPDENLQRSKASQKNRYSQQTSAVYPASSSTTNHKNWLTTSHRHLVFPDYPPDHQDYYDRPSNDYYKPHVNGPSSYPGGASSSATASANSNQGFGPGIPPYHPGSHYPSGASSSATATANNNQGFGPGILPYNSGPHYPNGASSSATASANNQPSYGPGFNYPSGATSSATANANNQQGYGPGSHYPSGATSSATASANNHQGYGPGSLYPSGATSSATASANNSPGYGNGATASANANAGNSGYNYHYRSSYTDPYVGASPYTFTNYVDQYGRSLLHGLPSTVNSLSSDPGNYNAYLTSFVPNHQSEIYTQPVYTY